jgi:hypothetical protein
MLPRLSRNSVRLADRVAVDVVLHGPPVVPVQPVDIDFAVAVPDVEDDSAIAAQAQLRFAEDAIAAGRGDDDVCLRERGAERQRPAAEVHCLELADGIALGDRDDRAEVARPFCDAASHGAEADDEDSPAKQREAGDALEGRPCCLADVEAVVERVLERDAVPVEHGEGEAAAA